MGKEEKKLLIASGILIVILAIGGLSKKNLIEKQEQEDNQAHLISLEEVDQIRITNQHATQNVKRKTGNNDPALSTYRDDEFHINHDWYVDGEVVHYANPATIDTFLDSLYELEIHTLIEGGEERLDEYELSPPLFEVEIQFNGKKETVSFGSISIDGESRYVYHKERNMVGLVGLNLDYLDTRTPDEWYETSIVQLDQNTLGSIDFQYKQNISMARENDTWKLSYGAGIPAKADEIGVWLRGVNSVRADRISVQEPVKKPFKRLVFHFLDEKKPPLVFSLLKDKEKIYIDRSDDPYMYEIDPDNAQGFFASPTQFIDIEVIENDEAVSSIEVKDQNKFTKVSRAVEWMVEKPVKDTASVERVSAVMDMLLSMMPKKFVGLNKNIKGLEFNLVENGVKRSFIIDPNQSLIEIKDTIPWTVQVELPKEFGKKIREHIQEIRKRDLYPFTYDDLDSVELVDGEKKIHIIKDEDGQMKLLGAYPKTVQFDVLSLVKEIKIKEWAPHNTFNRLGNIELHLASKKGASYTWHLGQVDGDRQMILSIPKFVAGWVEKDKLDELIKKL